MPKAQGGNGQGEIKFGISNAELTQGDNLAPGAFVPFDERDAEPATGERFVPPYYQLAPIHNDAPDVLDICEAMGLDVQAYLVVETIAKLHRYNKKGYPVKDLNKAIEQVTRLRDIVVRDAEALTAAQTASGSLPACRKDPTRTCPTLAACMDAPGGCNA